MYNRFWESHRVIIPELRDRVVNRCCDCRFFICIQGIQTSRWCCLAGIGGYQGGADRVTLTEILQVMAVRELAKALNEKKSPESPACRNFQRKIKQP